MKRGAKAIRVKRELTPDQKARAAAARKVELEHRDQYAAEARKLFAAKDRAAKMLRDAFALLREERRRQGLSFAEVGKRAGMSRGAVSNLEQGARGSPTLATLLRCAEALGIDFELRMASKRGPVLKS